jgi:hypothetical protein
MEAGSHIGMMFESLIRFHGGAKVWWRCEVNYRKFASYIPNSTLLIIWYFVLFRHLTASHEVTHTWRRKSFCGNFYYTSRYANLLNMLKQQMVVVALVSVYVLTNNFSNLWLRRFVQKSSFDRVFFRTNLATFASSSSANGCGTSPFIWLRQGIYLP